ncbi:hypothetical protein RUM44_005135 [Polyplax serrata]|uniref:Uncharacterized protein n=1 Tax=Polyplax serrata TaxID=468196 RepID=A0ABR1AE51_POLSC
MAMKGLTWESLKKTPSLIPLFIAIGVGIGGAAFYPLRCALKNPEVVWNKSNNEPWNEYKNKEYKFYSSEKMKNAVFAEPPKY